MGMKKNIIVFLFLFVSGCSDYAASSIEDEYAFVYSDDFTKVFEMDSAESVDLPEGVNALRSYKAKYAHGESFNLQIYLDERVNIKLDKSEKTFIVYDNALNGFLRFSDKAGFVDKSIEDKFFNQEKKQSDEYGYLVISYAEDLIVAGGITRYTKKLIPSYTLIEVMLPGPDVEAVYLYTGDTPLTEYGEIMDLTNKLAETGDLSAEGYLKVPLPEEIQTFYMNNCGDLCPP